MAFDFPTTPATGTIYAPSGGPTYRYDGLVWSMISTPFQGAFPSDTAPTNPVHGQLWWESDTGLLYVYYTDANSSQWVEVVSSGLPGAVRFDVAQTLSAPQQVQAQGNIGLVGSATASIGYMKLANGIIVNFGTAVMNANGDQGVTFATAFPTALVAIFGSEDNSVSNPGNNTHCVNFYNVQNSQANMNCRYISAGTTGAANGALVRWTAIGF